MPLRLERIAPSISQGLSSYFTVSEAVPIGILRSDNKYDLPVMRIRPWATPDCTHPLSRAFKCSVATVAISRRGSDALPPCGKLAAQHSPFGMAGIPFLFVGEGRLCNCRFEQRSG